MEERERERESERERERESILHLKKAQDERYFGGSQNFRVKHEFIS